MINATNFKKIDFFKIIGNSKMSTINDFNYAEKKGLCYTLGYDILFFMSPDNELSVIYVNDFINKESEIIAKSLLEILFKNIFIDSNKKDIINELGKPIFEDDFIEDLDRYYFLENDFLIIFGFTNDKINLFEVISDIDIINSRKELFY